MSIVVRFSATCRTCLLMPPPFPPHHSSNSGPRFTLSPEADRCCPGLRVFCLRKNPVYLVQEVPLFEFKLTLLWIDWDISSFPCNNPSLEVAMALAPRKPEAALALFPYSFQFVQNIHHQIILAFKQALAPLYYTDQLASRAMEPGDHNGRCHYWGTHLLCIGSSNSSCYFLFESSSPK